MAITSRDVAREAGVAQSTVSRALGGDRRISDPTRLRVMEVADRLGYTPNAPARSLITSRTFTVGVVVEDIANPLYPELVEALHSELAQYGYRMVLFNERTDLNTGDNLVPLLLGNSLDGVIFTTALLQSPPVEALVKRGLPVVLVNRYVEGIDVDVVVSDNLGGAGLAAQFLVGLGHRWIGMITGPETTSTSRDRESSFRRALERLGSPLSDWLRRAGPYSYESGYRFCMELLKHKTPPTAVFCGNDVIALGALNAARSMRVDVPSQLSILGFDDIKMASWEVLGLTTLRQPVNEKAKSAARMLIDRIEQGAAHPPRIEVFPVSLVERNTTGPPSA